MPLAFCLSPDSTLRFVWVSSGYKITYHGGLKMSQAKIGVIGGTGFYNIEGLKNIEEIELNTPFGKPSDAIVIGNLEGVNIAFLPRHGRGHHIMPSELPSRANIYALKSLGVEHIISICSVGSFKKEMKPGDLIIPDQRIDRTQNRINTFFGDGIVAHIPFANPFCSILSQVLYESAKKVVADVHSGGVLVVMEGPAFSTSAESRYYRSLGVDVICMTTLPEAKLAREAEICYSVICCITDYDSWWKSGKPVTADMVLNILRQNADAAKNIIKLAVNGILEKRECECPTALATAIVTSSDLIPVKQKKKLDLIIGKYL